MASLRKRGRIWYYRFIDLDGKQKSVKGCADKRETERMAVAAETEVARIKAGLVDPREIAHRDHAARPIIEHIEAFKAHLEAKDSTPKHISLTAVRIRRLVAVIKGATLAEIDPPKNAKRETLARFEAALSGWLAPARLGDLTADAAQSALRSLVREGIGLATVNHYRTAAKAFTKWALRAGRLASDPLAGLSGYNAKEDVRHDRRTIGLDELRRLIEIAHRGEPVKGVPGPVRALAYRLAVATGLRHNEIRSIRPESFDWRSKPPTVNVKAAYTKNGQTATLPLSDDLAEDLRAFAAAMEPGEAVFSLPADKGAVILRADLKAAGIPYRDDAGRVFDFHSLRCQLATNADAMGVTPRVVQRLMRHSTLELTGRYTRPRAVDLDAAALSLPSLRPESDKPDAMKATGTEDCTHGVSRVLRVSSKGQEGESSSIQAAPHEVSRVLRVSSEGAGGESSSIKGGPPPSIPSGEAIRTEGPKKSTHGVSRVSRVSSKHPGGESSREPSTTPRPSEDGGRAKECTDVQTINKGFGLRLAYGGDVSGRNPSHDGMRTPPDKKAAGGRLEAQNTGFQATEGLVEGGGRKYRGPDSNRRPADYETVARSPQRQWINGLAA